MTITISSSQNVMFQLNRLLHESFFVILHVKALSSVKSFFLVSNQVSFGVPLLPIIAVWVPLFFLCTACFDLLFIESIKKTFL